MNKFTRAGVVLVFSLALHSQIFAASSSFTYQGRLDVSGSPANGVYDFQFRLFDALTVGAQVGSTILVGDITVSKGLFSVPLDFGLMAFNGSSRWLQIGVRAGASTGAYTTLLPRQEILPTPYSLHSVTSSALGDNLATVDNLAGIIYLNDAALVSLDSSLRLRGAMATFSNGESGFATWGPNGSLNLDLSSPAENSDVGYVGVADERGQIQTALGVYDNGTGGLATWGPNDNPNVEISSSENANHGFIGIADQDGYLQTAAGILSTGEGYLAVWGPNGSYNVDISSMTDYPNNGFVGVADDEGFLQAGMYVDADGDGVIFGDYKQFVVDHPKKSGEKIIYTSLEGSEAGIYERGTARLQSGRALIELPEPFVALAQAGSISVQLTPGSFDSKGLGYKLIENSKIEIRELNGGEGEYEVSYLVHAQRANGKKTPTVISNAEFEKRYKPAMKASFKKDTLPRPVARKAMGKKSD